MAHRCSTTCWAIQLSLCVSCWAWVLQSSKWGKWHHLHNLTCKEKAFFFCLFHSFLEQNSESSCSQSVAAASCPLPFHCPYAFYLGNGGNIHLRRLGLKFNMCLCIDSVAQGGVNTNCESYLFILDVMNDGWEVGYVGNTCCELHRNKWRLNLRVSFIKGMLWIPLWRNLVFF